VRLNANRIGVFTMNASPNPSRSIFQPDGTFVINNVSPGNYDLVFTGLPPDSYVREARYGGVDALAEKIPITGPGTAALEIAVSTNSAQISGVVTDRDRRPDAILIPEGSPQRPDRYKTARTDANGRYLIRGVAPGSYKLYSWETIDRFRYFDSEFVRQFERQAKSVRVAEGEKGIADLDIITVPR
jgi:hypothetical protein